MFHARRLYRLQAIESFNVSSTEALPKYTDIQMNILLEINI